MSTRSLIGVRQADGLILAIHVAHDGDLVGGRLTEHYGTAERATMLVSLGDLMSVDAVPKACVQRPDAAEARLVASFDDMKLGDTEFFHLFEGGRWITTMSEDREWLEHQLDLERRGCQDD